MLVQLGDVADHRITTNKNGVAENIRVVEEDVGLMEVMKGGL